MADWLGRIERLLEEGVEGTSRRLFRARLEPVQLMKAAGRAMEGQRVVGPDGPVVPNRYRIALHPADFAQFAPYRRSLQADAERYLERFAAARGLRPAAALRVELLADGRVRRRGIAVEAELADVAEAPPERPDPADPSIEGTAVLRPSPERARPAGDVLVAEDGRRFPLAADVTTLGRALDNHVVIADSRVSRHHAEILRVGAGYAVRDLGSTNGTAVGGRQVTEPRTLADGDVVSLGGFKLVAHLGHA